MFSSPLFSSLVALVASAVAVSAAPALSVWTWTFNADVYGLENLEVTTTIVNTGDETLKLLHDPHGVLDNFPENSFSITDAAGSRPSFVGARVNHAFGYLQNLYADVSGSSRSSSALDPPVASMIPGCSLFSLLVLSSMSLMTVGGSYRSLLTLKSHEIITPVSAAYDFTQSGPGYYSIEPSNLFTYLDADGTLKNLYATVEDVAEVGLSGTLAIPRVRSKRVPFINCSLDKQSTISTAAASAQAYASEAYSYLRGISGGTPRYTEWFGLYTPPRKSIVENHFQLISSRSFSSFTYDCAPPKCKNPGVSAYVCPYIF